MNSNAPAHTYRHRVAFYETDAAGIVHFSNFFRYAELCEQDFLLKIAQSLSVNPYQSEFSWPRVHASFDYKAPAHCHEYLDIQLHLAPLGNSSLRYHFKVFRENELLATGQTVSVCVKMTPSPVATPLPLEFRQALEPFTNSGISELH